jgi:S-formylglutathione hydrolase FrmB
MLSSDVLAADDFAHDSRLLGRRKVAHVLPPAGAAHERPLFVMLHPFGGNRSSWLKHAPGLMAGLARDLVVVLPECGRNWFINDHSGKRYEDYLITELIPAVRASYAATGAAYIGGFSMGGASAFFLALRHPDEFAAAFAVAGAFTAGNRQGDPYAAIRSNELMIPSEAEHERVWGPPGSAVRNTYEPLAAIQKLKRAIRLPEFHFEVGTSDYPRALEASALMQDLLQRAGARYTFAEQDGDHSWSYAAEGMARLIAQFRRERGYG